MLLLLWLFEMHAFNQFFMCRLHRSAKEERKKKTKKKLYSKVENIFFAFVVSVYGVALFPLYIIRHLISAFVKCVWCPWRWRCACACVRKCVIIFGFIYRHDFSKFRVCEARRKLTTLYIYETDWAGNGDFSRWVSLFVLSTFAQRLSSTKISRNNNDDT